MAKAKYKRIFEEIWDSNKELFQEFFMLNNDYADPANRTKLENKFQEIGGKVKNLLVDGENELCRAMENTDNRVYSSKVADKYWDEVRKYFKFIDLVGVVSSQS
ncbi:MAG: hypothetical protein PHS44_03035 [Candidatus Dojkabacteria bacterium]|nr:hypothetical protein [Candidatus Dojkabacteria bacterium]